MAESGPVLTRVAFDGPRRVEFRGAVLAAATTARPGVGRWTETTVYRTHRVNSEGARGIYVVAKVGRSIMAHRRTCLTTDTRRLPQYLATPEQGQRMPCLECGPQLVPPAPDVVVEVDRHRLMQAPDPAALVRVLFPGADLSRALFGMSGDLVVQLHDHDPDFQTFWDARISAAARKE
jgi:hypothetical protein